LFGQQRSLKLLAATVAALAFSQNMVFGLLVVYGRRTLHLSNTGYGVFLAAASLVGVIGAFSGGRLQRRFGPARLIVGGAFLCTLSYLGLSFTRSAVLAVFVLGLQEVGIAVSNVGSMTTRQRLIPRHLFGRVASVHRLAVGLAAPLGAVLGGLIASGRPAGLPGPGAAKEPGRRVPLAKPTRLAPRRGLVPHRPAPPVGDHPASAAASIAVPMAARSSSVVT
jgi:predicted MFS family arabinose efflux permease